MTGIPLDRAAAFFCELWGLASLLHLAFRSLVFLRRGAGFNSEADEETSNGSDAAPQNLPHPEPEPHPHPWSPWIVYGGLAASAVSIVLVLLSATPGASPRLSTLFSSGRGPAGSLPAGPTAIFLLCGAYLVLRSSIEGERQKERLSSVYALIGAVSALFLPAAAPPASYLPLLGSTSTGTQLLITVVSIGAYATAALTLRAFFPRRPR